MNDQFLERYPVGHRIDGLDVAVEVEGLYPAANQRHHVPAYNFHIRRLPCGEVVGNVSFRLGSNVHIDNYAGNIGFNVDESQRGHGFAAKAVALIREVIRAHGFDRVFITCDPDNHASRRTCEKIGARLLGEVTIPEDNILYARGMRTKLRFEWRVGEQSPPYPRPRPARARAGEGRRSPEDD
jgi:tagatose 1,6-diphosphate aldolase